MLTKSEIFDDAVVLTPLSGGVLSQEIMKMKEAETCYPSNRLDQRIFFILEQYQFFLNILTYMYLEVKLT